MNIIDNIIQFLKSPKEEEAVSPEGICPVCWGRQEYDGKIKILMKDKQIDINNHQASYTFIKEFVVTNIDGIKLKGGIIKDCPNCTSQE